MAKINGNDNPNTLYGTADADIISGFKGNDTLYAQAGNDRVNAGAGNDWVYGGPGNDILNGEAGSDNLHGQDGNDMFICSAGDGRDTLNGGAGLDRANYDDNVSTYAVELDLDISKTVRKGQIDTLIAIEQVTGSDAATDSIDASRIHTGLTINLASGLIVGSGNAITSARGFEQVVSGDGNDRLIGNDQKNTLLAGIGNDWLFGAAGSDTLDGGNGNDTLTGGTQGDILLGGAGDDLFILDSKIGFDQIVGGVGNDTLRNTTETPNLHFYTYLTADVAKNTFFHSIEVETIESVAGENDIVNASKDAAVSINLQTNAIFTATNAVRNIIGFDHVIGSDYSDILVGNDGNNQIAGNGGNDTITGGGGSDTLNGGAGHDVYLFFDGWGTDTIIDGGGTDKLDFTNSTVAVVVDLESGRARAANNSATVFFGRNVFEYVTGTDGNDRIQGQTSIATNNVFQGRHGDDTYLGYASYSFGHDVIYDLSGNDTLYFRNDTFGHSVSDSNIVFTPLDLYNDAGEMVPDNKIDSLRIGINEVNAMPIQSVTIHHYFDNSTSNVQLANAGHGHIETMVFMDDAQVTLADVKADIASPF